jgi:hypothetical protein
MNCFLPLRFQAIAIAGHNSAANATGLVRAKSSRFGEPRQMGYHSSPFSRLHIIYFCCVLGGRGELDAATSVWITDAYYSIAHAVKFYTFIPKKSYSRLAICLHSQVVLINSGQP